MKQCLYFYMIIILMKSRSKICDIAEINRSTFYRYFQDKYELLYTLPDFITQQIIAKGDTSADITTPESFEDFIYYIGNNKRF